MLYDASTLSKRPHLLFALLYFAEGAPIGFIWWTLPTLLRGAGVEVDAITTLTAWVTIPWALKFAWAPLVDTLTSPRFTLRGWIVTAQFAMAASLAPLLFLSDPADALAPLTLFLVLHAFAAATQDVAIDALSIAIVPAEERGRLNGWMQAGMLFGRALFGGGALLASSALDLRAMAAAMIAVLLITPLTLLRVALPPLPSRGGRLRRFLADAKSALRRPLTWLGLAFALTAEVTFKGVGAVIGPFLVDSGVSEQAIGVFFGVGSVGAMVVGALVGGRLADRFGRRRVIAGGQLLVGAAVVALAALGTGELPLGGWLALLVFYLGVGLFTAAVFALFMDLTEPRLGATQFSAYMGLTNACEAWSSRAVGALVTGSGYPVAFLAAAGLGLVPLLLLPLLKPKAVEG
ncbi:MAG: MFS transporter [Sandaracinaceae bacterium]